MQVSVKRTDVNTLEISSNHPELLTLACLEIGGAVKLGIKIKVDDLKVGEVMSISTGSS